MVKWLVAFVVCLVMGAGVGVVISKLPKHVVRNQPVGSDISTLSQLSSESCKQLLDRPTDINFSIEGTLVERDNNDVLLKFNEKESLWISMTDGYKVVDKKNSIPGTSNEIGLGDVSLGSLVRVKGIGLSDRNKNFMYASSMEVY